MNARYTTTFMIFAATFPLLSTFGEAMPGYIWNASNSVPTGLYRVRPVAQLAVSELVVIEPPVRPE